MDYELDLAVERIRAKRGKRRERLNQGPSYHERTRLAIMMHAEGKSYAEIGVAICRTRQRAKQIIDQYLDQQN